MSLGPVDYSVATPPAGYSCKICKAYGCKLWRPAHMTDFYCAVCAGEREKVSIDSLDARGLVNGPYTRTDQIGNLLPAIPDPSGETCWGYSSVRDDAVNWWKALPSRPVRRGSWDYECPKCRACGCGPDKPKETHCSQCGHVLLVTPPELGIALDRLNQEIASKALALRERLIGEWAAQLGISSGEFEAVHIVRLRASSYYEKDEDPPHVLCSVQLRGAVHRG